MKGISTAHCFCFSYVSPVVSGWTTIMFFACSGLLWVCFLKSWRGDPGVITPTQEQRFRVRNKIS